MNINQKKNNIQWLLLTLLISLSVLACDVGVTDDEGDKSNIRDPDEGYIQYVIDTPSTQGNRSKISGYVTQSRGSNPIAESTVTLALENNPENPLLTTQTNSDGYFQFDDTESLTLENGRYIVEAQKTERATSKIIFSLQEGVSPILALQQFPFGTITPQSKIPPAITVSGITPGTVITSKRNISLTISIAAENPLLSNGSRNPINVSLNSISNVNYTPIDIQYSDYSENLTHVTAQYQLDPLSMPTGHVAIEIVSYDHNNNQSILIIPFINAAIERLAYSQSEAPASSPATYTEIYTSNEAQNNNLYSLHSTSDDNTTLVNILVRTNNQGGILVYRLSDENDTTPFLIGSSTSTTVQNTVINENDPYEEEYKEFFFFADTHPTIHSDTVYYYTLKYYKHNNTTTTTSDFSSTIAVPILPRIQVTQTTPADKSVLPTPLSPCQIYDLVTNECVTFEWDAVFSFTNTIEKFKNNIIKNDVLSIFHASSYEYIAGRSYKKSLANVVSTDASLFHASHELHFPISSYVYSENYYNKEYYWYVTTNLTYEYAEQYKYKILSYSRPSKTRSVIGTVAGIATNAGYYFTIQ